MRIKFPRRELLINISPGTPAMQTIRVLMAEAGFIAQPFRLVQTFKRKDRRDRPAALDVRFGLRPFFERYEASRPREFTEETSRIWAPHKLVSAPMINLFKEARRVACLKTPILILGERGTGKTTLTGWIRAISPFRKKDLNDAWPAVACGQYTVETIRAELFGDTAQAFTGATKAKTGLLKIAHGDTLFLDEIDDVGSDPQRLLIRALKEKRFLPLGANKPELRDRQPLRQIRLAHNRHLQQPARQRAHIAEPTPVRPRRSRANPSRFGRPIRMTPPSASTPLAPSAPSVSASRSPPSPRVSRSRSA